MCISMDTGNVDMSAWVGRPEKKEKVYCYIDGGAVRSACSKYAPFFEEHELSLSWSKVAEPYERVFYYDALPGHAKKGESDNEFDERIQRARDKFESMRKTKGIFVNYGVSIRRRKQIEQKSCLLYTSPSPRDLSTSRMPSSA